jgi:hypothetical protein
VPSGIDEALVATESQNECALGAAFRARSLCVTHRFYARLLQTKSTGNVTALDEYTAWSIPSGRSKLTGPRRPAGKFGTPGRARSRDRVMRDSGPKAVRHRDPDAPRDRTPRPGPPRPAQDQAPSHEAAVPTLSGPIAARFRDFADRQDATGVDLTPASSGGEGGRALHARAAVGEDPTGGWMC